jgi:hypothetical protein
MEDGWRPALPGGPHFAVGAAVFGDLEAADVELVAALGFPWVEEHRRECLYKDLGAGGVDLPGVWRRVEERGYQYWITLDLDPPRMAEGEGTVEDKLPRNRRYLQEQLAVEAL